MKIYANCTVFDLIKRKTCQTSCLKLFRDSDKICVQQYSLLRNSRHPIQQWPPLRQFAWWPPDVDLFQVFMTKSSKLTRCILITKQMCCGKRGKHSGGENRKYFWAKRKILELWTKNEKYWSEKNPVEKNKKERLWYSQRGRSVRKFDRMIAERYIERKQKENMELFVSLLQIFLSHQGITLHFNWIWI